MQDLLSRSSSGPSSTSDSFMSSSSQSRKRNIDDFFKPYAQVPAKRPSPATEDDVIWLGTSPRKPKHHNPKTPVTATRVRDVPPSAFKSPFRSGASVKIPIRSPLPKQSPHTVTPSVSPSSPRQKRSLFDSPTVARQEVSCPQPLSFSDLPSSNQRIIKNGKVVAVKGSDEEDSDSLSSLEDILKWKD